jgi:hypothetical protein
LDRNANHVAVSKVSVANNEKGQLQNAPFLSACFYVIAAVTLKSEIGKLLIKSVTALQLWLK